MICSAPKWASHIKVQVQNMNLSSSLGATQVTFQSLTVQEHLLGWEVSPMQLSLGYGETHFINVTLTLLDHIPETCPAALGLVDNFMLTLNGTLVDMGAQPFAEMHITLVVLAQAVA